MRAPLHRPALAIAISLALAAPVTALAQNPQVPLQGQARDPVLPPSSQTIPEKVRPDARPVTPDSTGSTGNLSEQLNRSDGVIRPDSGAVPDNTVKPPASGSNAMPVIRPGELPGQGNTQPK